MRLQLSLILTLFTTFVALSGFAQTGETDEPKVKLDDIEINFLSSYYVQDGNNSPVTGGIGTEYLDNIAPSVVVVVPLDSVKTLDFSGGIDVYSSASSDNIDNPFLLANHVSGESSQDTRFYGTVGYKKKNKLKHSSWGATVGGSIEYDVASLQLGTSFSKASPDDNREISLKASYYVDNWKLIYPVELRNGNVGFLPTNIRHTGSASITGSFVLSRNLQTSITTDLVFQQGLLSTPFHRVYFPGQDIAVVEQLPSTRFKTPVGLRLNYSISDWLILRSHYRFYWDNWDVVGNTFKLETPIKISQTLRFYPFYRYHTQTAARYYAPYMGHNGDEAFYTSDTDLSALSSHKVGFGFSVEPLFGIARFRAGQDRVALWKRIDIRYSYYHRSDGLHANIVTAGFDFAIKR